MPNSASSRKKPVKKPAGPDSERALHHKCWQWVQKEHPDLLIFHVANERKGGFGAHMHFKRMGVIAGVADFLVFPRGRAAAIELKDDEGEQTTDQKRFQKRWGLAGHIYVVVRTLEEFQGAIRALTTFG